MAASALVSRVSTASQLDLRLANHRDACEAARLALLEFLRPHGIAPEIVYRLELILEESLMNVIWHAFDDGAQHLFDMSVRIGPRAVVMRFEDDGIAFDPLRAKPAPAPTSIDEAVPGGLGLLLVRKFAETVDYERVGGRNCLTIGVSLAATRGRGPG